MALDFRASQGQFNKIIASGSTGTGAKLVIYDIRADTAATPNQGVINNSYFNTSSIGQDVFLFISGGIGNKNGAGQTITVFGGDVHISGNLSAFGSVTVSGAAGSTGEVQYNNGTGALTASTGLVYRGTTFGLSVTANTSSFTGSLVVTKQLQGGGAATTAAAFPGIAFDGDHDTGFWTPEANRIIVVAGGASILDINNNGAGNVLISNNGTAAIAALGNGSDTNTGMFFPSDDDQLAFTAGGTKRLEINSTGLMVTGTLDVSGAIKQMASNLTSSFSGVVTFDDQILIRNPQSAAQGAIAFANSRGTGLRNNGDTLQLMANGVQVANLEGSSPSMTVPYIIATVRLQPTSNTMTILGANTGTTNPAMSDEQAAVMGLTTAVTQSFKRSSSTFGPASGATKAAFQDHIYTVSQSVGCTGNYVLLALSGSEVSYTGNNGSIIEASTNGKQKFRVDRTGSVYITDDASGATGPTIEIHQDSASPAVSDVLGEVKFFGNSSTGVKRKYGGIQGSILLTTNGVEYGEVNIRTMNNGGDATALRIIGDGADGGIFSNAKAAGATPPIRFRARANYAAGQPIVYFESNDGNTLSAIMDGDGDLTLNKDIYAHLLSGSEGCRVTGTIDVNGGHINKITTLTSSYAALVTDYILAMSASTTSSAVVTLPASPETGRTFIVKDIRGTAAVTNITVTSSAGTSYIDGGATYVIAVNYGSAEFVYFGGPTPGWGVV